MSGLLVKIINGFFALDRPDPQDENYHSLDMVDRNAKILRLITIDEGCSEYDIFAAAAEYENLNLSQREIETSFAHYLHDPDKIPPFVTKFAHALVESANPEEAEPYLSLIRRQVAQRQAPPKETNPGPTLEDFL